MYAKMNKNHFKPKACLWWILPLSNQNIGSTPLPTKADKKAEVPCERKPFKHLLDSVLRLSCSLGQSLVFREHAPCAPHFFQLCIVVVVVTSKIGVKS